MRNIRLLVSYDGTNYNGFQRQKNGVGVQQVLERVLSNMLQEEILLVASGRTDAGVHALGQVVSFHTKSNIPVTKLPTALTKQLPGDIVVLEATEEASAFHARYGAKGKTYQYRIALHQQPEPFVRNYVWELVQTSLDIASMQKAAQCLLGTHDFTSFRNMGSAPISPVRTITEARWELRTPTDLRFTISGDGFLYRMVRNIVGCLVRVGKGDLTVEEFAAIMAAKERKRVGMSAPPQGLYLVRVEY